MGKVNAKLTGAHMERAKADLEHKKASDQNK